MLGQKLCTRDANQRCLQRRTNPHTCLQRPQARLSGRAHSGIEREGASGFRHSDNVFCFGLGFVGQELVRTLRAHNFAGAIGGTVRASDGKSGVYTFDGNTPMQDVEELRRASHILISIPPKANEPSSSQLAEDVVSAQAMGRGGSAAQVLQHHLDDLGLAQPRWVGLLGTTGVYGDWGGDWVDETCELRATNASCRQRIESESLWMAAMKDHGLPVHVFRLAGLYGPGRSALNAVDRLLQQTETPSQVRRMEQRYTNRVHVSDVSEVLRLSMLRPTPGEVFNVADNEPASRSEVLQFAAELRGVELPGSGTSATAAGDDTGKQAQIPKSARAVARGEKRIQNTKAVTELNWTLQFPTYREGLQDCLRREQQL